MQQTSNCHTDDMQNIGSRIGFETCQMERQRRSPTRCCGQQGRSEKT